jgi:hypothetical protein
MGGLLFSSWYFPRSAYHRGMLRGRPQSLSTGCSRRLTASAALRLSGAAEPQRCYDFQCQGSGTTFVRSSSLFSPLCMKRGGARKRRRLILLLAVGWLPPSLHPSGACLNRGTSIPVGSPNAAEGYTTPGLRLFSCTLANLLNWLRTREWSRKWSVGLYSVTGTSLAMAHTKPTSSRAMATVTTLVCFPLATRRW